MANNWIRSCMNIEYKNIQDRYKTYIEIENSCRKTVVLHLKMTCFFILSLVFLVFCSFLVFLMLIGNALFSALIMWRSLHSILDNQIITSIKETFASIASFLGLGYLEYIMYPFIYILTALANIKINFSAVNVTCEGSKAPLKLVVNCLILGYIVKVIESSFLVYSASSYKKTNTMILKSIFSQQTYKLYFKVFIVFGSVISGIFADISLLRYVIGFFFIKDFFDDYYILHTASPACNAIAGVSNIDSFYAISSSLFAWFVLTPVIYLLASVLVPYDG